MADERLTGEVIYIRVPKGTRGRRDAARGRERASDYDRRIYLDALAREEGVVEHGPPQRAPVTPGSGDAE